MKASSKMKVVGLLLATVGVFYESGAVAHDRYPSKPLTIFVGFSAGGGVDRIARVVAKFAPEYWGANAVVVDKPGAGGAIAMNALLRRRHDGYTLGAEVIPNVIYQPAVRPKGIPGYKTNELVQIGLVSRLPAAIYVGNGSPWKTLSGLVADAKRHPGKLTMGVIGANTVTDGFRVQFEHVTHTRFQRVVFKGGAPLSKALIGGDVNVMVANAMFAVLDKGTMRPLAFASGHAFPMAPDVPTFKSSGYDLIDYLWRGIAVPKGTPESRIKHLRVGLHAMLHDPKFQSDLKREGIYPYYLSPRHVKGLITQYLTQKAYVMKAFKAGQ